MTLERFSQYVKLTAGGALMAHLVINMTLIDLLLGHPELAAHPLPVALPVGLVGALWGFLAAYRSPPAIYVRCPTCHSKVLKESIDLPPRTP